MTLWVLGLNHQTAPVDLRERVAFDAGTVPHALSSLRALPDVVEAALLSTCNRTELYAVAEDGDVLASWLATHADGLEGYLYRHSDADAVRHLFRVATGLDSMVLGEPQILGQVKQAWAASRQAASMMPASFSRRRWASVARSRSWRPCARYHEGRRWAIISATAWRSTRARAVGSCAAPPVGEGAAMARSKTTWHTSSIIQSCRLRHSSSTSRRSSRLLL